ncbi:hypothetical protein [Mesorhizobium sp. WSM2239]|uniref:Uncharacterized protein n=2 Tax=unclassified Mesorhizobium TaxID=325217 RepID=A0AAU8D7A1_9HYPH
MPGFPAGTDIIGRIFDSLGNPVTVEFRLNTFNTIDTEFNPSITALANGGFAVVYDESGAFTDLNIETYPIALLSRRPATRRSNLPAKAPTRSLRSSTGRWPTISSGWRCRARATLTAPAMR